MKAAVFVEPGRIVLEEKPVPLVGPLDALLRVTTTTICGTDVHILKGEYRVARGLTVGHEPVGVIEELGTAVTGYEVGQRVIVGAITPCGQCHACLNGDQAQCGGKAMGGWRLGNTIDGCQAEYVLIPDAMANLAAIPDALTDEQVLMCPDIMSTGFSGAERARIRIGDTVAVFAQGPIGLCATVGAKLSGATRIFTVDGIPERLTMSRELGADLAIDYHEQDPVAAILQATDGRGVDVAIEAWVHNQRSRVACACCGRAEYSQAWVFTQANSPYRWTRSQPDSATTLSYRRYAPAAKNECAVS
jgi:threonine dehydrogenase-like Zn-dependent dehydrogenase